MKRVENVTYKEAVEYIHSLLKFGIKPGLQRISYMLNKLGNPQDKLKIIHVAGTNGKGSTCAMLSSILQAAGYKTGLFISPYVIDFRERFQISGQFISKTELAKLTTQLKLIAEEMAKMNMCPTEFEFITALALLYFYKNHCDYVVIETGLGGRFDSTNVVKKPLISIITSISFDHTDILGDTIEKIAREKAGIIKPGCPAVTTFSQDPKALKVLSQTAQSLGSLLHISDPGRLKIIKSDLTGSQFIYKGSKYGLNLLGGHQILNALPVIDSLILLNIGITVDIINQGLQNVQLPARCELISQNPLVILDGAHNPGGSKVLSDMLSCVNTKITAIIGMMRDKDADGYLEKIAPCLDRIITVEVKSNSRSLTAQELKQKAQKYCNNVTAAADYESALRQSLAGNSTVLICGSLFLASEIRELAINFLKTR